MPFKYWFYCAVLQQSVQCGKALYELFTLRCRIKTNLGVFYSFFTQTDENEIRYCVFLFQIMLKTVSSFYSICLRKLLFNWRNEKNVKQKAGFRWNDVLKSMFCLLFTRINYKQSSIVSKISVYLATHVRSYCIR